MCYKFKNEQRQRSSKDQNLSLKPHDQILNDTTIKRCFYLPTINIISSDQQVLWASHGPWALVCQYLFRPFPHFPGGPAMFVDARG